MQVIPEVLFYNVGFILLLKQFCCEIILKIVLFYLNSLVNSLWCQYLHNIN